MRARPSIWSFVFAALGAVVLAELVLRFLFPDVSRFVAKVLVTGAMLLAIFVTGIYHIIRIGR